MINLKGEVYTVIGLKGRDMVLYDIAPEFYGRCAS